MIITYVYADNFTEWNCSNYNAIMPMKAINRTANNEAYAINLQDFSENSLATQNLIEKSDIIFVERNLFGDTLTMIQYWKVRGKSIAVVFDDSYDNILPENKSYNFWTKGELKQIDNKTRKENIIYMKPSPLTQLKWGLQIVKGATFPSVNLCNDWGKYTKTFHVRNNIEPERYVNIAPLFPHSSKEIWIGWCGSLSHVHSFTESGIIQAMERISKEFKNVKILIGGDKRIYDAINVNESRKAYTNFVPVQDFAKLLKSFDIPFAPLSSNYDMRRSWVKVLEYMALQIPWVATDCITYEELKPFGKTVVNSEENWYNAIVEMIDKLPEKREYAKNDPYQFALNQSVDVQLENRLKIYQQIIDMEYPERKICESV
jgi:glycosyltransferase involved in cell wall biosynthesis